MESVIRMLLRTVVQWRWSLADEAKISMPWMVHESDPSDLSRTFR